MMDQWRRKLSKSEWASRGRLDFAEMKAAVAVAARRMWPPLGWPCRPKIGRGGPVGSY